MIALQLFMQQIGLIIKEQILPKLVEDISNKMRRAQNIIFLVIIIASIACN
jgi:hypothetical protein